MSLYLTIFRLKLYQLLQYRSEFIFNIIGDVLSIYIQICIWRALLTAGNSTGVTAGEMATYTVVSFIMRGLTKAGFSMAMAEKVKTGNIAIDFIRPINLQGYMFAEQLGKNALTFLTSSIPIIFISSVFFNLMLPSDLFYGLLFLISVVMAVILMYMLDYTLCLTVFWLKNGVHPRMIMGGLFTIFSGATVPLWFFPGWLAKICEFLPFRMVSFEPIQIYMGRVSHSQAVTTITLQCLWIIFVTFICRAVWSRAKHLVFVQGG